MQYALTAEQAEFASSLRAFLEQRTPLSERPGGPFGAERFDRRLWSDMATQLDVIGIAVPEHFGGSGFGEMERGLVIEELGRALVPTPYFASAVLALPLLTSANADAAFADEIADIVAGRQVASVALAEPGGGGSAAPPAATVAAGGSLSGAKTLVMDGDLADLLIVSALDADAITGLYLVSTADPGVSLHQQPTLDPTRGAVDFEFDAVTARRIDRPGQADALLRDVLQRARVALAFEQLGGAAQCLELAVEHAKNREQFGKPIGGFQAVKHLCADVLCDVEAARSAVWYAAWALTSDSAELDDVIATTKYVCSQAYLKAARTCVHVHGGIGFTWEHPAQLFFKRATASAQFLGSPDDELARLADTWLPSVTAQGSLA